MAISKDRRGFDVLRIMDGTNIVENRFGEIEKVFPSNGGYGEDLWHGTLLARISRLNERARIAYLGGGIVGHYNLQLARIHNELMRQLEQPLPHPTLPPLAPRSAAEYGIMYGRSEDRRQKQRSLASASAITPLPSTSTATPTTSAATATPPPGTTTTASTSLPMAHLPPSPSEGASPAEGASTADGALLPTTLSIPPEHDPAELAKAFRAVPDGRGPAAKKPKPKLAVQLVAVGSRNVDPHEGDVPGISAARTAHYPEGMVTAGKGAKYQLTGFKLKNTSGWKRPLCQAACKGWKSASPCSDWCEYGIIKRARNARGISE